MRIEGARFELGMKLHADEPGMILMLDHLRQEPVRRHAGKAHAMLLQAILVAGVDLVAMAVTLGNFRWHHIFRSTRLPRASRAGYAPSRIVPPRSLSRPRALRAHLPFIHSVISPDHRVRGGAELRRTRILYARISSAPLQ